MDEIRKGIDRKSHRLREENLARKRNQEYQKQQYWNDIQNYYRSWDVKASKYNVWASQPPSPISAERMKELQKENLKIRRHKLAELLSTEQKQFKKEMEEYLQTQKENRRSQRLNLDDKEMESANGDFFFNYDRSSRSSDDEFIKTHPIIQSIEKKKNQDSVRKSLSEQMKEKQQQEEYEKEIVRKMEEENERLRLAAEEKEKEITRRREEEVRELKNYLLNQMQEVKKKDLLAQELKQQELQEISLKTELEKIAVRRSEIEKERKKKELCSFLRHQYQLKLKQKNKEIQEQLDEDRRLITEISECFERQEAKNNKIREDARKEIDRANEILCEYSKMEREREREMEFMFFEEAKKMWQKQEKQWSAEQEFRDRLMKDVLIALQKQTMEKLERNKEEHEYLANEKEDLLKKMEEVNNQLKESEIECNKRKKSYMNELQKQIQEKEYVKTNEEEEKRKEYSKIQEEMKEKEEKVLQELKKMNISTVPSVGKIANLWR